MKNQSILDRISKKELANIVASHCIRDMFINDKEKEFRDFVKEFENLGYGMAYGRDPDHYVIGLVHKQLQKSPLVKTRTVKNAYYPHQLMKVYSANK
jgi:hypothetical protein